MKHLKLALLISAIIIFAVSCACTNTNVSNNNTNNNTNNARTASTPVAVPPASDEFAAARSTYTAVCARCHQANGEGGAVEFDEGGTLQVPSFKSGKGLKQTDIQFARQIAKGGDGMPAFEKKLAPEQINALVRFIRKEFQAGLVNEDAASPSH